MIRLLKCFLVILFFFLLLAESVSAQEIQKPSNYPKRSIELVITFGPGGGVDTFARTVSPLAEKDLGVNLVSVNKPGANSIVGMTYLLNQPADGYTLAATTVDTICSIALGTTKISLDDFIFVIQGTNDMEMLFARTNDPRFKTYQDYVNYAKANPGKVEITVGGEGGLETIAAILVSPGLKVKYIPHDKPGKRYAAFLGGHHDLLLEEPSDMKPYLDEGKVRPLIQLVEKRPERFKDIPTAPELGMNVTLGMWRCIVVKKGTNPQIIKYLASVFKKAMETPKYQEFLKSKNLDIRPYYLSGEELAKRARMNWNRSKKL